MMMMKILAVSILLTMVASVIAAPTYGIITNKDVSRLVDITTHIAEEVITHYITITLQFNYIILLSFPNTPIPFHSSVDVLM
jgi:glucan phosphoethanolaminetransferase (alkaline phosphatase superfamily)